MHSTRLAILSVAVGSTLLGTSAAGITAVADLPKAPVPTFQHQGDGGHHHGRRSV
jgi:hypothetical protein